MLKFLSVILFLLLLGCRTKDCLVDTEKQQHSCPEAGHGACPFCTDFIYALDNQLFAND
jgi:hypothetical protein